MARRSADAHHTDERTTTTADSEVARERWQDDAQRRAADEVPPAPGGTGRHAADERPGDARRAGVVGNPPGTMLVGDNPAKTSAAAAFALAFGVAALFASLTALLAPLGVLFGILALALGVAGRRRADQPLVTGRGVALSGIITGVLGLLLGIAVIVGAVTILSDDGNVAELERQLRDAGIEIQR